MPYTIHTDLKDILKEKMNDFKQILSTISRPFQQETRKGCQDDVVINGMGAYVELWVGHAKALELTSDEKQHINQIAALFANYSDMSPTEREKAIQNATEQIKAALSDKPIDETTPTTEASENGENKKSIPTPSKQVENLPLFQNANVSQRTTITSEDAPIPEKTGLDTLKSTKSASLFPLDTNTAIHSENVEDSDDIPVVLGC